MDTPERNQIGTPISKIEESPFSSFINNLSPINPIKTVHVSQTFSSISFTSPPSVFTSPHVSLQKEYRFLRRHQGLEIAKSHFSSVEEDKDSQAGQALSTDQQPNHSANERRVERVYASEAAAGPLCDISECPTELQNILKYDGGSPDCKAATSHDTEQNPEPEASGALVPFVSEPSNGASFGAKFNSQQRDLDNEEAACDWQSLIAGTTDLFAFDSPNDAATLKGPFQKSLEEETRVFASLLSRFPSDDTNDLQCSHHADPVSSNEALETTNQSTQPTETDELKQTDKLPQSLSISALSGHLSGDFGEKSANEPFSNLQRGMRRRCLNFEMPRVKNNTDSVVFSRSSSTLQNEEKSLPDDRQPITPRDSSRCILPGIGLHLNALAAAAKDCSIPNQDTPSPLNQEPLMILSASTSCEKNVSPAENALQVVEDSSQTSTYAATEESHLNSPKKKRRKFENVGDAEGCKRCNCKKSKCLKLYCECFAAGVYCMDSCSCQDCFNKPIHEDTVLATRKQIESRNPLAFAPKVIRASESVQDLVEDSSRTPASARHKRGCNCKKSNCLKKYCECYQGGVGCSISCRCEGCKNAFGRKDGPSLLGAEAEIEEAQASEKHIIGKTADPPAFRSDEDQNSEFTLPKTPLRRFRPSAPLPTSSKDKPPRSLATIGLHPIDGSGRSTFLRSQSKIEKHFRGGPRDDIPPVLQNSSPPSSGIKTLSPNGKRVSPPHHGNGSPGFRSSRRLILQSIPSFPSLTPRH